ncbi:MAG: glycogen/starch synthase, partial [Verrucomicrobia bacterium]|nr:glycogen/starch synthase [Verrucomicrobiota bacterium]
DIERFIYFSKAALEFMILAKLEPDVLHLHEWHVGLVAPLVKDHFLPLERPHPGVVFTIHNLEHQGRCSPYELERIGLTQDLFPLMRDEGNPEVLNLLKGGIVYSDHLTTVSPTYAREILTPLGAKGLEQTLNAHAHKLTGILNGLDYALWGPSIDPFLPTPYSHDVQTWGGKKRCKQELQMRFSLTQQEHRPLVGFVGRLVPQKGIDLVKHVLFKILEAGGQFILLGSAASSEVDEDFHTLKIHFGDNPNIHLELHHNEELVHLIYAGSDMLLVPSRFEPCGLTQLIALHYGAVPIARHTGGLADTIIEGENGFVFHDSNFEGVESAVKRALETYLNHPDQWQKVMSHGMRQDFSWRLSATKYEEIYRSVKEKAASTSAVL